MLKQLRAVLGAAVLAGIGVVGGGCETNSALDHVEVTYRFENVRQTATLDEWTKIRQIINAHAKKPVTGDVVKTSSNGGVHLSTYQVAAVLPNLRALDAVQADLEELAGERVGGSKIQFTLAGVNATYRSNVVAAGVEVRVAGVATPGYLVRVYQDAATFVEATANRSGEWSAKLAIVPEARWVYGSSADPAGVMPTRYFRVDVSSQRQEDLEEAEFLKAVPRAGAAGSAGAKAGAAAKTDTGAADRDAGALRKQREAEDAAVKKRRDAEDAKWGKKQ